MGLDSVEFIMGVEESFELEIPDADVGQIATPGELIDYLCGRLPTTSKRTSPCVTQAAFNRIRRAAQAAFGHERNLLRPEVALDEILPPDRRAGWQAWREEVGARVWPSYVGRVGRLFNAGPKTVAELARLVGTQNASFVRGGQGWTRREVEEVLRALILHELGIEATEYTLNSSFTRDMGVN